MILLVVTKRSMNDTPVIISGLSIGRYVKFMIASFFLPFRFEIPVAAKVPMTVDVIAAEKAIIKVVKRPSSIAELASSC